MQEAFPDASVTGYQDLALAMKNHEDDRHVLAAAVRCGAHAIVTDNQSIFLRRRWLPTASNASPETTS